MEQIKTHWQTLPMESSVSQADFLHQLIEEAEAIVIGIGAGMSAATGFTYAGKRFTDAFPDFIAKYRFFDMLQASLFDLDRKSTRLNSSHVAISYAVFCLKK